MIKKEVGRVILLTGISGSGKSTLSKLLVEYLNTYGNRRAYLMDGDLIRSFLDNEKKYSPSDRKEVSKMIALAALTLTENNIDVIVANIAPFKETRDFYRRKFPNYIEVYLKLDLRVAIEKDVKGVYQDNLTQKEPNIVGLDIPYEEPDNPDVVIYPYKETVEESISKILSYIKANSPILGTKADTLSSLGSQLSFSNILPQVTVTYSQVVEDSDKIIEKIKEILKVETLIVRSSCNEEDSISLSNAGAFKSVLNVKCDRNEILESIKTVYNSYLEKKIKDPENQQILIQPMLQNVKISGVVLTRHKYSDSPYYVINYVNSSDTEAITSGKHGKILFINRSSDSDRYKNWKELIRSIKEIEALLSNIPLDIEFAIGESNEVFIFQCRPLLVEQIYHSLEKDANDLISELKERVRRYQALLPQVPGDTSILSDMADWNPSEIIGEKPNTLSYTLYREIITSRIWHEARNSLGYFDIVNGELMCSLAKKPYIDTRLSFASLTPNGITKETRSKLINQYLTDLKNNPKFHDKIEFEIVYSCYDFSLKEKLQKTNFLNSDEKEELSSSLHSLTSNILDNYSNLYNEDSERLGKLDNLLADVNAIFLDSKNYYENFQAAYLLIEGCRKFGCFSFARIARIAFIAHSLLNSLVEKNLISIEQKEIFLASIPTAATDFYNTLKLFNLGGISEEDFYQKYGHLRMNTYDISTKRYDQLDKSIWKINQEITSSSKDVFQFDENAINQVLIENKFSLNAKELFDFIKFSIQQREDSKFRFTKSLSQAIEYIAKGGELLGFGREEIKNCNLSVIYKLRNPEFKSIANIKDYLRNHIGEKKIERSVFDLLKLPPIIVSPDDLDYFELSEAKPNFISDKVVSGEIVFIQNNSKFEELDLKGKVVLIENADPGYDWIFTHNLKALVTKFGGVASHMAIRCSEFSLPGVIGCGELIFQKILNSPRVLVDCKSCYVKAIYE